MMGMVLGHIFNHVTKRVPAWETRQCFSNPTGHLLSTLLNSLSQLSLTFVGTQTFAQYSPTV